MNYSHLIDREPFSRQFQSSGIEVMGYDSTNLQFKACRVDFTSQESSPFESRTSNAHIHIEGLQFFVTNQNTLKSKGSCSMNLWTYEKIHFFKTHELTDYCKFLNL